MSPAEKLRRAREKAEAATRALEDVAVLFATAPGDRRKELLAAAKTATNAWHEVGRAEKAARG